MSKGVTINQRKNTDIELETLVIDDQDKDRQLKRKLIKQQIIHFVTNENIEQQNLQYFEELKKPKDTNLIENISVSRFL